jgi:hypothetical protein
VSGTTVATGVSVCLLLDREGKDLACNSMERAWKDARPCAFDPRAAAPDRPMPIRCRRLRKLLTRHLRRDRRRRARVDVSEGATLAELVSHR